MWIQAETDTNLRFIDLSVFADGPDETVRFSENNTANVEETVGVWLIENYSIEFSEYENETTEETE